MRRSLLPALFALWALSSCGPSLHSMRKGQTGPKRSVAFGTTDPYNPFEEAIAAVLRSEDSLHYLCRLVQPDPEATRKAMVLRRENLSYLERSSTRQWVTDLAAAAGVDHVIRTTLDQELAQVVTQAGRDPSTLGWLLGQQPVPTEYEQQLKKAKFRLIYYDGHTGLKLWKMQVSYAGGLNGTNLPERAAKRFRKKFPFRTE